MSFGLDMMDGATGAAAGVAAAGDDAVAGIGGTGGFAVESAGGGFFGGVLGT